ncbi:hypothetical protein [Lonsdalea populi]|uniref:UDP-glucuronosyltransferase n=1 Tax=Lonsdalea populi TaxID=1172565 RepID=A0A3N0U7I0_9GAMM|nr:hypothetical protein [Lonsdalea populi]OSM94524.1 hypothetical protein AU508_13630 [Lonsdalea populi]RAT68836.1 hypothetical protein AU504_12075 [Lonsdalea populi]RAT71720.1 hypothetical protein AU505_08405 [Lonsdalea populi]RAT76441.1 hypothetical protein AU506_05905 [Lonsdalea populi]RAT77492.1 hypothetical protein AU507_11780 [Lonsdalea populi]
MIAILTSGVALGVHVPGLLLARRLQEHHVASRVDVFEQLMRADKQEKINQSKQAFHRNFRVALAGQRLARDLMPELDEGALARLFSAWEQSGVKRFVVVSGFWQPIIQRYRQHHADIAVDRCHIDSVTSPSFQCTESVPSARDIWLASAADGALPWSIPVSYADPIPWHQRSSRILAHGGGWGLGTYAERAPALAEQNIAIDIVAYHHDDITDTGCRYFMIDPDWRPWQDSGFPPFGEVTGRDTPVSFQRRDDHHDSFELARQALGILSKPGGGTLLDSLWSATPLIFLEPFGPHEQCNASLWERLELGITLEHWRQQRFSLKVLETLHQNLLAQRRRVPDYARYLAGAGA